MSGFYREWSHEGIKNEEVQIKGITCFADQIESASFNRKHEVLIMGDANLDAQRWEDPKFVNKLFQFI